MTTKAEIQANRTRLLGPMSNMSGAQIKQYVRETCSKVLSTLDSLTGEQATWKPGEVEWSAAQVGDHVAIATGVMCNITGLLARGQAVSDADWDHHCGGFIETPEETERLMDGTDAALVGLCFDTGHWAYAGGDPLEGLRRFGERIWHVHFKDCHNSIAERARTDGWDYFTAVRKGIFYGLGDGDIDFRSILSELRSQAYAGWVVVEDELPPGMGNPLERAKKDREYLRQLGV